MTEDSIAEALAQLGITFRDKRLMLQAFTHPSAVAAGKHPMRDSYEGLEFLGDSVLNLLVLEYTAQKCPDIELFAIADRTNRFKSNEFIGRIALRFELGELILADETKLIDCGRRTVETHADLTEALFGAVYLDQGMEAARALFRLLSIRERIANELATGLWNAPIVFENRVRAKFGQSPEYVVKHCGRQDPYLNMFTAKALVGEQELSIGAGSNPNAATFNAAYHGLRKLFQY